MERDTINDKLIELIREKPIIFDSNQTDSNIFQAKEKQWAEIAKKLCIDVTFLKKRWKVIRDRYRKEWNTINNDPYYKEDKCTWRYYKKLSYLEPYMKSRTHSRLPKFEQAKSQQICKSNEDDDLSQYMEVLESDHEEQPEVLLDKRKLIEIVKTMPYLYDSQNDNFYDLRLKQFAWESAAKELNSDVATVKLKWQELCNRFLREYKKSLNIFHAPFDSSFEYYETLSFLKPSINSMSSQNLETEIIYCNSILNEEDASYEYVKEEEEVTDKTNNWLKLDDLDCKMVLFIRNNPMLYDTQHPYHKDISMCDRKWAQISFELGVAIKDLKARWQTLQELYRLYDPSDQNKPNSRKFIEMFSFLDQNPNDYDSDSASNVNIKYENDSDHSVEKYTDLKIHTASSVKSADLQTHIPSLATSHHSPSATNHAPHESVNSSHVKMFFDSIAAQIEAENLPFRHFSIIQQEVLKVVHQQISSYLEHQK